MKLTLVIALTAIIVGGATFFVLTANNSKKTANLENTIAQLQANIAIQQQVNANTSLTTANTNTVSNTNVTNANTSTTTPGACQSSDLVATLSNGQGTAGTYYYTLAIRNTGTSSCRYNGTTKVALQNSQNATVGSATTTSSDLTIGADKSIYAAVGFPNSSNYSKSTTCTPGVMTMAITPPSQTTAATVSRIDLLYPGWTNYYCPGFSVQAFSATQP